MTYRLIDRIDDNDIPLISIAYRHSSISRFISIDERNYWNYVTDAKNVWFYKTFENDHLVATIHLELNDHILHMSIVVFPEYQKRGIATKILKDIQKNELISEFDKICVSIDENNTASLKLFENAGFICVDKDEELREYEYV